MELEQTTVDAPTVVTAATAINTQQQQQQQQNTARPKWIAPIICDNLPLQFMFCAAQKSANLFVVLYLLLHRKQIYITHNAHISCYYCIPYHGEELLYATLHIFTYIRARAIGRWSWPGLDYAGIDYILFSIHSLNERINKENEIRYYYVLSLSLCMLCAVVVVLSSALAARPFGWVRVVNNPSSS